MTTYYVANAGSDAANGTSTGTPWKTLAKASAASYLAGDSLLLNCGDKWRETLTWPSPGTSGSRITIGQYGVGSNPVITGGEVYAGSWALYAAGPPPGELFFNASLDAWTGGHPTSWSNTVAGTSTVTQEGTIVNTGGGSSAKLTSDAGGSVTQIEQTVSGLSGGTDYTLSFWHEDVGGGGPRCCYVVVIVGGASAGFQLQHDGTFAVGSNNEIVTNSASWAQMTRTFTIPAGATGADIRIKRFDGNFTFYVDDTSFQSAVPLAVNPNTYRTPLVTQAYVASRNGVYMPMGGSESSLTDGQFFWRNNYLYVCTANGNPDSTGDIIEAGKRSNGILLTKDYVTIQDLTFTNQNGRSVRINGASTSSYLQAPIVTRCTFKGTTFGSNDPLTGISTGESGVINMTHTINGVMSYNTVIDCVTDGLYGYSSPGITVTRNTIFTCWGDVADNIQLDYYEAAAATVANWTVTWNYCSQLDLIAPKGNIILFGNGGVCTDNYCEYGNFGVSANGDNNQVLRNTLYRCSTYQPWGGGLFIGDEDAPWDASKHTYDNTLWAYNVAIECRRGAVLNGTGGRTRTNQRFYHNTFFNSTECAFDNSTVLSGAFKNNIIWCTSGKQTTNAYKISNITGTWDTDYNTIGPQATNYINYLGTNYSTLAAYVAARSKDAHSQKNDPLFRDETVSELALQGASPAVDTGVAVVGIGEIVSGSAPDMGAHEYYRYTLTKLPNSQVIVR